MFPQKNLACKGLRVIWHDSFNITCHSLLISTSYQADWRSCYFYRYIYWRASAIVLFVICCRRYSIWETLTYLHPDKLDTIGGASYIPDTRQIYYLLDTSFHPLMLWKTLQNPGCIIDHKRRTWRNWIMVSHPDKHISGTSTPVCVIPGFREPFTRTY